MPSHNNQTVRSQEDTGPDSPDKAARRAPACPGATDDTPGEPDNVLRAYLQLPKVDASAADVEARCRDEYLGNYATIEDIALELTDLREFQLELEDLINRWGLGPIVQFDPEALETTAHALWHVVRFDNRYYVFAK